VPRSQWRSSVHTLRGTRRTLTDAMAAGGAEAKRAFTAMMEMGKLDIAKTKAIRRADRMVGRAESPKDNSLGQSEPASDALGQLSTKSSSPERAAEFPQAK
jgi:hypothetical protein